jgi:hypothetical protein
MEVYGATPELDTFLSKIYYHRESRKQSIVSSIRKKNSIDCPRGFLLGVTDRD